MGINWDWIVTITQPLMAFCLGIVADRYLSRRPRLVTFYGHVSAHRATGADGQTFSVHTHDVVLRNLGRASATNVRLSHQTLPNYVIFPPVQHHTEVVNGGGIDIVIPVVVPKQQLVVSYLYFPPLTAAGINSGVKSDEGFAKSLDVLLQPQAPKWFLRILTVLVLIGFVTCVYGIFAGVVALQAGA